MEQNRSEERRRSIFWSTEQWQDRLHTLIVAEENRDHMLKQWIAQGDAPDDTEEVLYSQIEEDIIGYDTHLSWLQAIQAAYTHYNAASEKRLTELNAHAYLIARRHAERQASRSQMAVIRLERLRRIYGQPDQGQWQLAWAELHDDWRKQDTIDATALSLFRHRRQAWRAYDADVPEGCTTLIAHRRMWCLALRAYQHETRAYIRLNLIEYIILTHQSLIVTVAYWRFGAILISVRFMRLLLLTLLVSAMVGASIALVVLMVPV